MINQYTFIVKTFVRSVEKLFGGCELLPALLGDLILLLPLFIVGSLFPTSIKVLDF
jgi:hypothetical protein